MKYIIPFFFILFSFSYSAVAQPLTAVVPKHNIQTHLTPDTFGWNSDEDATSYTFELSADSLFGTLIHSQSLTQHFLNYTGSLSNGDYFWRITAHYAALPNRTSQTHKFTIFTPAGHPNLKLWIAADTGVVITSGAVSQWNDLSGNNFHLTQTTAANRPIILNNAIGNKPAVKFDGVNDFLDGGNILNLGNKSNTIFLIGKTNSTAANATFFAKSLAGAVSSRYAYGHITSGIRLLYHDNSEKTVTISGIPTGIYHYHRIINNRNTSRNEIYLNNSIIGSIGINSSFNMTSNFNFLLGAYNNSSGTVPPLSGSYLNGEIAELIFIDSLLSSSQIFEIEAYLSSKYNAPSVSLGYDIKMPYLLCDTAITGANKPWFSKWIWNTGDTTATIRVKQSGKYWVRATNIFGITSSDTIMVNYAGHQTFADTTICLGDTLTYTYIKDLPYQINWSNGDTGKVFKTTLAGNYNITLTDSLSCSWQTSFIVKIDSFPNFNLLPESVTLCAGNQIQANIHPNTTSYLWSPGNENSSFKTIFQSDTYHLTVENARGCQAQDSIAVIIQGVAPNPNFQWSLACTNDSIHFINLSQPIDSIASYTWNFNNGFNSNLIYPSFVFDTAGTYSATLSINSFSGCSKDTTLHFQVFKKPNADFEHLLPCINTPTPFYNLSDLNQGYSTESIA